MVYAVVLAAGLGLRMKGSKVPKQFLMLGTQPIIAHTVDKFSIVPEISKIIIVVSEPWLEHSKAIFKDKEYLSRLEFCIGGNSRQESLYNACKHIVSKSGDQGDYIISHDAVRPFVSIDVIKKNIDVRFGVDVACDTVVKATDTIVRSEDGHFIHSIPDRNFLYQGQTPQSFVCEDYIRAYEKIGEKESVTDAAKLLQLTGVKVALVEGEPSNIKITTDYDLSYAQFLMRQK